jgi:membrane-associated phospholipid phosphatase
MTTVPDGRIAPMDLGLRLPSTQLAFAVITMMIGVDLLALPLIGLRVEPASLVQWLVGAAVVLTVPLLCAAAIHRLRNDPARGARLTSAFAERVALLTFAGLAIGLITTAGAVLSYAAAAVGYPLQDARLAAIDRAIGVDWIAIAKSVCGTPWLESTLAFAYRSSMTQVMLLVPLLALTAQRQRLSEFVALFAVTGGIVCILSAFVPAEAAFFHFQPSVICPHVPLDGTLRYHPDLMALRAGSLDTIEFGAVSGIVTFPSFHTALAIVVIYAAWGLRFFALPVLALNLLVIAATLPLGGHYFIDVVAGAAIAFLAIAGVRRLNRNPNALLWPMPLAPATPSPPPRSMPAAQGS